MEGPLIERGLPFVNDAVECEQVGANVIGTEIALGIFAGDNFAHDDTSDFYSLSLVYGRQ
jgi:hypothetical protein